MKLARNMQTLAVLAACAAMIGCSGAAEGTATGAATGVVSTAAAATSPGQFQRIDFTLPDLDGNLRKLSDWDGDLVLLNFWATWCPPCKKEMPMFQERYEQYAGYGFTIVAVAVDELNATQSFVDNLGIEFPILIGQDDAIDVGREYGNRIGALPYTVLIDRDGIVRETHRGEVTESDLAGWLETYL